MLRELGQNHTIMLSSHMLTEVETLVQRVIILRRGHLGSGEKAVRAGNRRRHRGGVRGPSDQIGNALRGMSGVLQVTTESLGDGLNVYEVRTRHMEDIREQVFQLMARNNWVLRRLDLRRRRLQDRWNEINNARRRHAASGNRERPDGGRRRGDRAGCDSRNAVRGHAPAASASERMRA